MGYDCIHNHKGTKAEAHRDEQERAVKFPQGVNAAHQEKAQTNNKPAGEHQLPRSHSINQETGQRAQNTHFKPLQDKGDGCDCSRPAEGLPYGVKEDGKAIKECAAGKETQDGGDQYHPPAVEDFSLS